MINYYPILMMMTPKVRSYSICSRSDWTWNDVTNATTGKIWMDRNLGSNRVATAFNDDQAYGMLYAWGRLSDGHQCVNRYVGDGVTDSLTTTIPFSTDVPTGATSNRFVLNTTDWRSPRNDSLWQGVNGINNPCPSGYRIATSVEWQAEINTWPTLNRAGAFNSTRKFTAGGNRLNNVNGKNNVGNFGLYWTSTVNGIGSNGVGTDSTGASVNNAVARSFGYSVRCIKN